MRDIRKSFVSIEELPFFLAWGLFLSTMVLSLGIFYVNNSFLATLFKGIRYVAYAICLFRISKCVVPQKHILPLALLAGAFLLSGVATQNLTFPLYTLIFLAAIEVDGKLLVKVTVYIQGILLFLIVALSQCHIIEDYIFDITTRMRHGLGFSWTTTGPILFFYFCMGLIYLKEEELTIRHYAFLEIINLWLFHKTDSKMAFLLLSAVLLFFMLESLNHKKWSILSKFNKLYIVSPFLMFGFTLLIIKQYVRSNPTWTAINQIMSNRLTLAQDAFKTYGLKLLGQKIHWIGYDYSTLYRLPETYNYVDSSYLQIGFNNGVLFLLAIMLLYSYGIYKAIKNNDYYLVMLYLIILLLSLTEPRLLNLAYNPFPLLGLANINNREHADSVDNSSA